MTQIDTGGPAFPRPFSKDHARERLEHAEEGMDLRDYLAARAPHEELYIGDTANWCANKLGITPEEYVENTSRNYLRVVSICRYEWADAMILAKRNQFAQIKSCSVK